MNTTLRGIVIGLIGAAMLSSCATTDLIKADKHGRYIAIVSSGDPNSPVSVAAKSGDVDAVLATMHTKLKKNKRDVATLLTISQLYIMKGKLDEGEKHCRQAIRFDVKSKEARKVLAQIHIRRGQYDMASIILASLTGDADQDGQILNLLGQIDISKGDNDRAVSRLKQSIKLDPGNVGARMNLAVMYVKFRQFDAAHAELSRVLAAMPDHPDAKLNMAIVSAAKGDTKGAESMYEEIIDDFERSPLPLYNVAALYRRSGEFQKSIGSLKNLLKTDYAKRTNSTDKIFALIDSAEQEMNETKNKLTDEDVNALSAKNKMAEHLNAGKQEKVAQSPENAALDKDELGELERALKE
jgi:predicted Zn-dependent protease